MVSKTVFKKHLEHLKTIGFEYTFYDDMSKNFGIYYAVAWKEYDTDNIKEYFIGFRTGRTKTPFHISADSDYYEKIEPIKKFATLEKALTYFTMVQ